MLSPSISRDLFTTDSAFPDTVPVSHLTYMDDSILMSSSYEGMTQLLSTCQEFYFLNNTAANPLNILLSALNHLILTSNFLYHPPLIILLPLLLFTP
jgi:hypothetical protein